MWCGVGWGLWRVRVIRSPLVAVPVWCRRRLAVAIRVGTRGGVPTGDGWCRRVAGRGRRGALRWGGRLGWRRRGCRFRGGRVGRGCRFRDGGRRGRRRASGSALACPRAARASGSALACPRAARASGSAWRRVTPRSPAPARRRRRGARWHRARFPAGRWRRCASTGERVVAGGSSAPGWASWPSVTRARCRRRAGRWRPCSRGRRSVTIASSDAGGARSVISLRRCVNFRADIGSPDRGGNVGDPVPAAGFIPCRSSGRDLGVLLRSAVGPHRASGRPATLRSSR